MKLPPALCTSLQPNFCEVEAATQLPWMLCQPPSLPRGLPMRAPQVSRPQGRCEVWGLAAEA